MRGGVDKKGIMHYDKTMSNPIYIRATDAGIMLGYTGRNSIAAMAAEGKIPGARQKGTKGIWEVPLSWVQEQAVQGQVHGGKAGKPRGYKQKK